MHEILFRGQCLTSKKWVEGHLIYFKSFPCIRYLDSAGFYHEEYVIPETVGQYTGLTDKNGKKIFEGDIVRYGDTVHKVIFEDRNKTAYFGLVYSPLETLPFGYYQDLRQIEVIGNVHDNPELLGGEPE